MTEEVKIAVPADDNRAIGTAVVQDMAFQIFLKRMPTSPLTGETIKGYTSTIEQSVEIAQLFQKMSNGLLEEKK